MRVELALLGVVGIALGCGGHVIFEGQADGGGQGGAGGGSTSASTAQSMVSTGNGISCMTSGCSAGSDGSCACDGVCNQQTLHVECTAFPGGATCVCNENGIGIAKCQESGAPTCDFVGSCCGALFFQSTGGGG